MKKEYSTMKMRVTLYGEDVIRTSGNDGTTTGFSASEGSGETIINDGGSNFSIGTY